MKKICYLLLLLCLPFASCNDEKEVVLLTNESPEVTVTSVSPQRGYVGAQVTIEGTDFGADAGLVSVFFSGVEEEAEIVSCEDTKLVVKVPEGATDGTITVKVREVTMQMDNLPFTVIPDPVMESVSPGSVYAGTEGHNEIIVTGSNFGTVPEDAVLYLLQGEDRIDAVISACEDNKITATIPEASLFGEFDVKMEIQGRAASGSFKLVLNEKAVITDISTDHVFGTLYAAPGVTLTIKGTDFGVNYDVIDVKVGELDAQVTSLTDTEIKVTIPEGFVSGSSVTVAKDGITTTSEKTLEALAAGTDVSALALKNYYTDMIKSEYKGQHPFEADETFCSQAGVAQPTKENNWGNGTWYVPADWTVNEAAKNQNIGGQKAGGLQNNTLILQSGWGSPYITNAKLYQTTTLPAGQYKLTVTLGEYFVNGGNLFLVVNKGDDLPDITNGSLDNSNDVCASKGDFSGDHGDGGTVELTFSLSDQTEVSIGFVATFGSANNNFRATRFKLEYTGDAN